MSGGWFPRSRGLVFGAVLAVLALSARADVVTYEFTGVINVLNDPGDELLGGQVKLGDHFSGTLTYDTSTGRLAGSTPDYASYSWQNLGPGNNAFVEPTGIIATVGSYSIAPNRSFGNMWVSVYDDAATEMGGVADGIIAEQGFQFGQSLTGYSLFLGDVSASAFSSTAPPTSITTSDFTHGIFTFYNYVVSNNVLVPVVVFEGAIDGLKAVPEPSSLALCLLAAPALLVLRRRSVKP